MRYLVDLVRECVHGDDLPAVEAAVNRSREELFDELCSAYLRLEPQLPPPKKAGEFVPGWRLDVSDLTNPYGNDPYFVSRAILYCHRIALRDPLYHYVNPVGGPQHLPSTMKEDLHKVLMYGALEEAGLLFYVNPVAAGAPRTPEGTGLAREQLESYFRDYMAPRGQYITVEDWSADVGDPGIARNAAAVELMYGLAGVRDLLDWQRYYADYLDLYVPEISIYRDTMEWLVRQDGYGVLGSVTKNPNNAALSALWSLPTPNPEAYGRLTVGDLLTIRDDSVFANWRSSLDKTVQAYAVEANVGDSAKSVEEFVRSINSQYRRVVAASGQLRVFRNMSGEWGSFGMSLLSASAASYATTTAFPGENALAAATGGAAAMLAAYAPKAPHAIRSLLRAPRRKRALDRHFDLFATDR